jgi:YVTN family beta-propeller protein
MTAPVQSRARCAAQLARALVLAIVGASCSSPAPLIQYEPYAGPAAYPDRREPVALPAGLLGFVSNSGDDTISVIELATNRVVATRGVGRNPVDIDGPHHLVADRARGLLYTALAYPALPGAALGPHAGHGYAVRPGILQVLALGNFAPVAQLPLDPSPGDVVQSPDGKWLLVSHFDLALAVNSKLPLGERRSNLIYAPTLGTPPYLGESTRISLCAAAHGLAFANNDSNTVYAACYGEDAIAKYSIGQPATAVQRTLAGPSAIAGAVVYGPYALVANPAGNQLVSAQTVSADLRFFALPELTVQGAPVKLRGAAYFPAYARDGRTLYAPTQGPATLARVDVESRTAFTERLFAPGECDAPHEAVLAPDESVLYVVCEGDRVRKSHILVVDPATLATRTQIEVGVYPDRFVVQAAP